jgi:DNA replication protein DnaC
MARSILPSTSGVTGPLLPRYLENDPSPLTRIRREAFERDLADFRAKLRIATKATAVAGDAQSDTTCTVCEGTHWVTVNDGGVRRSSRCACWKAKLPTPSAIDVPAPFLTARLENYTERPGNGAAIRSARDWLARGAGDLYLCGGVGTGKTRLDCSVLNEVFIAGQTSALFVHVPLLMLLLRQAIDDPEKKRHANRLIDRAIDAAVLCLDDVAGAETQKGSNFSRITLTPIYEQRLARSRRTLWNSNLDLKGLSVFYEDDRLSSRIAGQLVGGAAVRLSGEDLRVQPAASIGRTIAIIPRRDRA